MRARHNGPGAGTVSPVSSYVLQRKANPADPALEDEAPAGPPLGEPATDERQWSGDLWDGEPAYADDAYARLEHPDGSMAWLDKEGQTLTGWVLGVDGSLYRYTDPNMWAADVDAAQMTRSDGVDDGEVDPAAEDDVVEDDPTDGDAGDDLAEGNPAEDDPRTVEELEDAEPDGIAEVAAPMNQYEAGSRKGETTEQDPEEEEDTDPLFRHFTKKGGAGKSLQVQVRRG